MTAWLDRAAALARLGVRQQTLYAYVSRGRIGMRPDPDDPRRSLYSADDIEALVGRRARGRRPSSIAASAIAWGEPAIATSISTVVRGRLVYRGRDAGTLAERGTLEETAALLWSSDRPVSLASSGPATEGGLAEAYRALAGLAVGARPMLGRPAPSLHADAADSVSRLAAALGASGADLPVHVRLARAWSADGAGAEAIRRALVLLADHELNASTFAVRVAASTGAPIAACLLAGLATLSGPRHGGAAEAVGALADDAARVGSDVAIGRWLAREQPLPGFGHPLYPEGDPRAAAILGAVELDPVTTGLRDAVAGAIGAHPNVDFALLALARAYRLPPDAPFRIFAAARSVGWAAHAMEQVASGRLIRPRARYEGVAPVPEAPRYASRTEG